MENKFINELLNAVGSVDKLGDLFLTPGDTSYCDKKLDAIPSGIMIVPSNSIPDCTLANIIIGSSEAVQTLRARSVSEIIMAAGATSAETIVAYMTENVLGDDFESICELISHSLRKNTLVIIMYRAERMRSTYFHAIFDGFVRGQVSDPEESDHVKAFINAFKGHAYDAVEYSTNNANPDQQATIDKLTEEKETLQNCLNASIKRAEDLVAEIQAKDAKITELEAYKTESERTCDENVATLQEAHAKELQEKDAKIAELESKIAEQENNNRVSELEKALAEKEELLKQANVNLMEVEETVKKVTIEKSNLETEVAEMKETLDSMDAKIAELKEELAAKQAKSEPEEVEVAKLSIEETGFDETREQAQALPTEESTQEPAQEPVQEETPAQESAPTQEEPAQEETPTQESAPTQEEVEQVQEEVQEEETPVQESAQEEQPIELPPEKVICTTDGITLAYIRQYPDKYKLHEQNQYPDYEFYMMGDQTYYQYHIPTQTLSYIVPNK